MSAMPASELRTALKNLAAKRGAAAERFACELEFVEQLTGLHADKAAGWGKRLNQATAIVGKALASGRIDLLNKAVGEAETVLAPIGKVAKQYTIHCIGHAHIDMNWLWSWSETVAVTNDTFRTVLKLMDEFPDFCFTQSQTSVYEIIRKHNPAMFEQIKARVAEGRWEIVAPHWVEGDKNLASGESLAHHLLYSRRFFQEHFALTPEDVPVDWEPDTFGHAHTIPMIDAKGGVTRYYLCRGGEFDKPPVFWWQGPDGSRVLVNRETTWYLNAIGPQNAAPMLRFCEKTGLKDWLLVYGVGDHGGGPTRRDLVRAGELDAWPIWPRVKLDTTRAFYDILEKQGDRLPVLDRELNFEFTGCYTSQSRIKQANRYGENRCAEAAVAATLAWCAVNRPYPGADLREAWIKVLFGHFHDILPGSGVAATREYQLGLFQQTTATTGIVTTEALRSIAASVDTAFARGKAVEPPTGEAVSVAVGAGVGLRTEAGGLYKTGYVSDGPRPVIVFNPCGWARKEIVTATLWDLGLGQEVRARKWRARLPDGRTVPAQITSTVDHFWGHHATDLAFPASVGPLGYTTFALEEGPAEAPARAVRQLRRGYGDSGWERPIGQNGLENDFVAVTFDSLTGGIVSYVDKATGLDLACPGDPLAVLEYVVERPRGMTAWMINDIWQTQAVGLNSFQAELTGPYVAALVGKGKINDSSFTLRYTLRADSPWLEIALEMDWLERGSPEKGTPSLRMKFPLALSDAAGRYEIPFGSLSRPQVNGEEVPALRWADVTGKAAGKAKTPAGLTLLNDCKYGHSLTGSTLRLTLVRASYDPDPLPEIGKHTLKMAIAPHGAAPAASDLIRAGAAFNHPLQPLNAEVHAGTLPPLLAQGVALSPANVVLTGIKKAEDEDAVILRFQEADGKATTARVVLDGALFGVPTGAVEVDLLERPLAASTAAAAGKNGFSVKLPARGIASVKVNFR